eukprot:2925682-Amphidinium_carterae.1
MGASQTGCSGDCTGIACLWVHSALARIMLFCYGPCRQFGEMMLLLLREYVVQGGICTFHPMSKSEMLR